MHRRKKNKRGRKRKITPSCPCSPGKAMVGWSKRHPKTVQLHEKARWKSNRCISTTFLSWDHPSRNPACCPTYHLRKYCSGQIRKEGSVSKSLKGSCKQICASKTYKLHPHLCRVHSWIRTLPIQCRCQPELVRHCRGKTFGTKRQPHLPRPFKTCSTSRLRKAEAKTWALTGGLPSK